tara:strand:+ start:3583 stop:3879 length:297 start_codon:yes stop_codon:yes gene_type:complete
VFLWYHWGLKEKCHFGDTRVTLNGVYAGNGSVSQSQEIAPLTRVGKYRRGMTQNSGTPGVQFLGPILDHSRNTEGTKLREGQSNSPLPNGAVLDRICM